jgi:biopolymer transport protein ExbB/TolQ
MPRNPAALERAAQTASSETLTAMETRMQWLATIANGATFVGLFGTVWGIMSSFAAISHAQDTSLATVAPGIAESLAATAYGLAAAIPASIGYNRIGAAYARVGQDMASFVEERALLLISRPAEVVRDDGQRRRAEAP